MIGHMDYSLENRFFLFEDALWGRGELGHITKGGERPLVVDRGPKGWRKLGCGDLVASFGPLGLRSNPSVGPCRRPNKEAKVFA